MTQKQPSFFELVNPLQPSSGTFQEMFLLALEVFRSEDLFDAKNYTKGQELVLNWQRQYKETLDAKHKSE